MKPLISEWLTPEHLAEIQERPQNDRIVTMHKSEKCRWHITHNEKFIFTK